MQHITSFASKKSLLMSSVEMLYMIEKDLVTWDQ